MDNRKENYRDYKGPNFSIRYQSNAIDPIN